MGKILKWSYALVQTAIFACILLIMFPLIMIPASVTSEKTGGRISYFFLKIWAGMLSFFYLVWIKTTGNENIKSDKSFVYVANHNSFYDSVSLVWAIPGQFRPLGKIEITKAPLFGRIYSKIVVTVDRNSGIDRMKSIKRLHEILKQGISILIYPEGRMNKKGTYLNDFQDGAFAIAIESGTPIIPVAVFNTRHIMPDKAPYLLVFPGFVNIDFLQPISTEGLTKADVPVLKQKVHQIIENHLRDHDFKL